MSFQCSPVLAALLAGSIVLGVTAVAGAAENIGEVAGVTPAAKGSESGVFEVGTPVYRDETVNTGPSGILELKFLDSTRLALSSSSTVKLDQFVYAGNGRADTVVLNLGRGAFRFATGVSAKKAYRIQTPLAAIGVRGRSPQAHHPLRQSFRTWRNIPVYRKT